MSILCRRNLGSRLTLTHDLVDLPVLLAAHEFFMLIRKLDLDTHLVGRSLDERYLINDHHCCFDGVIRAINGEGELVKAQIRS